MIGINRTVGEIFLGPQYNLQGWYLFESLLIVKRLQRSHCTPVNIPEGFIEQYNNLNAKGCPEDLLFGYFNNQHIPSTYYDIINDCYGDDTPIDAYLADNEGVEDSIMPNDKDTDEAITTDYDNSLVSYIGPPPNEILEIEGVDRMENETEESSI